MITGLILALIFGCKKEDHAELARLGPLSVTGVTSVSAVISGTVEYNGGVNVTSRGVVWSTSRDPAIEGNEGQADHGSGTGEFVITITGLSPATKYYVRGYAINSEGTAYSSQFEFTTEGETAMVTTAEVREITFNSAISGGNVTDDGGAEVSARGIVWDITENPSIDENDGMTTDGDGSGEFTSSLEDLSPGILYYVRAYATNSHGTAYGNQVEFTTPAGSTSVTTSEVTGITAAGAISGGNVKDDGGEEVTARGVVWDTRENPTIDKNGGITTDGDGLGEFTSSLEDLLPGTTYYVRAYATNNNGTFYGNQVEFTTGSSNARVTTADVTDVTDNSAVAGGNVVSDGGAEVTLRGIVWSTLEKPSVENNQGIMNLGFGTGRFSAEIRVFDPETTYYLRAFAINSEGVSYGSQVQFTTLNYPDVTTEPVTEITDESASVRGRVTSDGGATTTRGIVWDTSVNPTVENNEGMTSDGTGTGFFTSNITGLNTGTTYFARAWAENVVGVSYGEQFEFTTYDGRAVDIDKNVYFYVQIGGRDWMVSNLKTTRLNDGTTLQNVAGNLDWFLSWRRGLPSYCLYENDEKYKDVYGVLYNYYTVETEKLCPEGWRIPTKPDIETLINYVGGQDVAGGKLKGTGTIYWKEPNTGATDEFRFNALPGGIRSGSGQFGLPGEAGAWWTTTSDEAQAFLYFMTYDEEKIFWFNVVKGNGSSVRCMRGD